MLHVGDDHRMDTSGRHVRSRTSSTSSLRSPLNGSGPHPATPLHTPNTSTLNRGGAQLSAASSFNAAANFFHNVSPDQLAAGLSRVRAEQGGGSRSSSIPPTPAPTPNPLLQVLKSRLLTKSSALERSQGLGLRIIIL